MFDLERAVSEWRRQMRRAGLGIEVIAELEGHIRDEVDQQIASGADAEQAFAAAVQSLGKAAELRTEFVKAVGDERQRRRRFALAICFVSAGLVAASNAWSLISFDLSILERVVGACAAGIAALYLVAVPFLRRLFPEAAYRRFLGVMKIAIWIAVPLPIVFVLSASGKIPLQSHPMITLFIWLFYAAIGVSALAMGLMGIEPGDGSNGDSGGSFDPLMPRPGTAPPGSGAAIGFESL